MEIAQEKSIYKKAFLWNVVGSMFNSIASLVLLLFVTRICGDYSAGIFSLAFATAQLILAIGRYGMRAYQATDVNESIEFSSYITSRLVTCIMMILSSIVYIIISDFSKEKGLIIFTICILKMVDAIEDVFHGLLQQKNRLDIAGKLLAARNALTIIVFIVILFLSKNLFLTCFFTATISIIFCLVINIRYTYKIKQIKLNFSFLPLRKLFIDCFPLFIGTFLSLYIYNAPKYAIDKYMSSEFQTYYSIIFMPAFVINLFSEFIFKPLLTTLAICWNEKEIKKFNGIIIKLFMIITTITIVVIAGAYLFGIPVLSLIYGVNLHEFRQELIILLLGGGFGAGVYLLYNVLTSIRKQMSVLIGYLLVAIFATVFSPIFVHIDELYGASISYLTSNMMLFTIFLCILIYNIKRIS
ncbi:MAG: oligosaccharide flippase family protein [Clostridium beijerinckii]